jgi:hypothetical protein
MPRFYFSCLIVLVSLLSGCVGNNDLVPTKVSEKAEPANGLDVEASEASPACAVTVPQVPAFVPPAPYDSLNSFVDHFWFGSNALWTLMPSNGVWNALPHNPSGYTQKIFWWREGYVWDQEPEPKLIVTGERIDESAPPLIVSRATNAYASDIGSAMLVGVDFPTLGCWRVTAKYAEAELSFVIQIVP